jgi:2-polyprenyl-3-methyl-5-hydroxy-6-metoxy-1,4-benzoquinol methylase
MIDYSIQIPILEEFPNSSIIKDFSEFSGLSIDEIHFKMVNHQSINAEDFNQRDTKEDFYENSKNYIYDLLNNNWHKFRVSNKVNLFLPTALRLIKEHSGKNFMEFGGGLGVFCEIVKEYTGKDVTYVDIKGYISDFAQWRFNKYKIDIKTIIIPQDHFSLPEKYDIIFTDAVIEHLLPQQQEDYFYQLCKYLNKGGLLISIVDLAGEEEIMPMHFNVDINKVFRILEKCGMVNIYNNQNFATIWRKDF